jgi:3'(2'), 5'-bisphosphate nucleotidase
MKHVQSPELEFALDAVSKAMKVTSAVSRQLAHMEQTKEDRSPVTVADFAAQAVIAALLAERFPQDKLLGEESSAPLRDPAASGLLQKVTEFVRIIFPKASSEDVLTWIDRGCATPEGRFWTLDPVDGTKGFLRGEQYAVAFALLDQGQVKVSVLGCPHLSRAGKFEKGGPGTLAAAVRGGGAWITAADCRDFKVLKVSNHTAAGDIQVLRSVEASHANASNMQTVFVRHHIDREPVLMDSQAKYVYVAGGFGDLFFYLTPSKRPDYRMKIWDVAPGALVVQEAGGKITDMNGAELDFTCGETLARNPGLVISNGSIHSRALEILKEVQASRETVL